MKNKDTQLLEEAYQSIKQPKPINEGLFDAIGSIFKPFAEFNKMTKEVAALTNKFQTDLATAADKNKATNQFLGEVANVIDSSDANLDMVMAFEAKFFSAIFRQLQKSLGGVSGDEVQRQLEIPDQMYRRLIQAVVQSGKGME
jgi:hypothetical protein